MAKSKKPNADEIEETVPLADEAEWVTRSIRLPGWLYRTIVKDAERDRRSVNMHVIWLLERGCDASDKARS
jgi:hypothetical protein